jgi:pyruvate,water dikinase
MEARELGIRRQAEETADKGLRSRGRWWPRRTIFRWVLRCARSGVKNRENMRFARTRIYGLLREVLRAMGHHMANENVLDDPEDVFYLTIGELEDFVKGTAVTTRLRELAKLRRAEFDSYREAEKRPADRFSTYGMAYHRNSLRGRRKREQASSDRALRGIGCSPGVITAPVKILASPTDDVSLNREILVAERTDPGWVPLFPAVSGILIERGSILSHSAVVAREMGIPTIVGIEGLLATVQPTHTVTMDGSAGTVVIAESPGSATAKATEETVATTAPTVE